jgi:mono/diheme cytochrome c family protein
MKQITASVMLGVATTVASAGAWAAAPATKVDLGKQEYSANCASCHGLAGKGDGPTTGYLTKKPTDLTTLARNNGGVLPVSRLYDSIAGDSLPAGHGTREMPTWGWDYRTRAAEYYVDVPYDADLYVRTRILALLDYIERLQSK